MKRQGRTWRGMSASPGAGRMFVRMLLLMLAFGQTALAVETDASVPPMEAQVELRSATICSIGDFVIHDAILDSAQQADGSYDFLPMLSYINECMGAADFTVANVDGPMGGAGERGYRGYPQFNTPPVLIGALLDAGVDMLTLSNNHALDTYFSGLKAEIENCEAYGMDHVGGARTQEEHDQPVIRNINGISVGFLNYTQFANTMEQYCEKAASVYGINFAGRADFDGDVARLREAGADVVVAYMHWGAEYQRSADSTQKKYAKMLVEAGCDVIIGGHPHVVQPAYWLTGTRHSDGGEQRTLCVFSLGNFLSDQRKQYRDGGILFEFTIQETEDGQFEITSPRYIPTYVWRCGSKSSGYTYRVLPCEAWLWTPPEGMDDAAHQRLAEVWMETTDLMDTGNAGAVPVKQ